MCCRTILHCDILLLVESCIAVSVFLIKKKLKLMEHFAPSRQYPQRCTESVRVSAFCREAQGFCERPTSAVQCSLVGLSVRHTHARTHAHILSLEHFTSCFLFSFTQPETLFTDCSWTSGWEHGHILYSRYWASNIQFYSLYQLFSLRVYVPVENVW